MTAPTFRQFVGGDWKATCYDRCKLSTRQRVDSALGTQLLPVFGAERLDRIHRAAIHQWFDGYSRTAPAGANRTLDVLRQILNHAIACDHIARNPARDVRRNLRPKRTRFLSRAEVTRLHTALNAHRGRGSGEQQADVIRLLLLTGCRKSEILSLRWSEVGGDALYLTDAKTGPRTVFLNAQARAILTRQPRTDSPWVFPSRRDPSQSRPPELSLWRKVRREAGIADVRLHDLRHTFASHAVMRGVPLPVISRLLGHAETRMTLRYAHVTDRETEAAADRVGRAIAALLSDPADGPGRRRNRPVAAGRRDARYSSRHRDVETHRMHDIIESRRAEIRKLAELHGLRDVRVFGSMVRNDAEVCEQSDIDLLVTLPAGRTGLALGALVMDVQELTGRRVDVVTEAALHPALRARVLKEAQLL